MQLLLPFSPLWAPFNKILNNSQAEIQDGGWVLGGQQRGQALRDTIIRRHHCKHIWFSYLWGRMSCHRQNMGYSLRIEGSGISILSLTTLATEEAIMMVICSYPRGCYIFILWVSFQIIFNLQHGCPTVEKTQSNRKGRPVWEGDKIFPTWFQLFLGCTGTQVFEEWVTQTSFLLCFGLFGNFWWNSEAPPTSQGNSIIARVNAYWNIRSSPNFIFVRATVIHINITL